jgi:transposase
VHLTETCEDDLSHLITNGETTIGPAADGAATPKIHAALQQRGLLPGTHIVDTGFLDAELLVDSRDDYGVDLLGPTRLDDHWQARERTGFDAQHFQIDWGQLHATCPAGKPSTEWTLTIRPQPQYQALQAAQQREAADPSGGVCPPCWD